MENFVNSNMEVGTSTVQLSHSSADDGRYIIRVAPGIIKDAFGVLRLECSSSTRRVVWYSRFATDQTLADGQIRVPKWLQLYHDLSGEATIGAIGAIQLCKGVRLRRLFGQLPSGPIVEDNIQRQLRGQVIFPGAALPMIVLGQEEFYAIDPIQDGPEPIDKASLVGEDTMIMIEESKEILSFGGDQIDVGVEKMIKDISLHLLYVADSDRINRGAASSVLAKVIILTGLTVRDAHQIEAYLQGQGAWTLRKLPLALLWEDPEIEGHEKDLERRRELFCKAAHEAASGEMKGILWLPNLEFLSVKALKYLAEALEDALSRPNCLVCAMMPVFAENAAVRLAQSFYGCSTIKMATPRATLSPQESFEHLYNVGGVGMNADKSIALVKEASKFAQCEVFGEVIGKDLGSWDKIHGYASIKERFKFLVELGLFQNAFAKRLGVQAVKGILLHGPSGCGKSELVRALAHHLPLPIIHVRPARILSKYLGESEASLRRVFAKAREVAPCVLFIDNMEVLGGRRSIGGDGGDTTGVSERLLSTLLNEMDGVTEAFGVLVLGCTSHKELLDDALLRPGRLDHILKVGLPTLDDLTEIIRNTCDRVQIQLGSDDLVGLCKCFRGQSGADVINRIMSFALAAIDQPLPLRAKALLESLSFK